MIPYSLSLFINNLSLSTENLKGFAMSSLKETPTQKIKRREQELEDKRIHKKD